MANICCDDVCFFSDDNAEGIESLWKIWATLQEIFWVWISYLSSRGNRIKAAFPFSWKSIIPRSTLFPYTTLFRSERRNTFRIVI